MFATLFKKQRKFQRQYLNHLEFELFIGKGFPGPGVDEGDEVVLVPHGDVVPVW